MWAFVLFLALSNPALASEPSHGISLFGDLEYPADFEHMAYANPDAPKGGTLRVPGFGTFDSLNYLIRKGRPAQGLNMTDDSLAERGFDEATARYGLIAETIEMADDLSWVEFVLRPEARFHDGEPIKVADVIFTFETLKAKGSPNIQSRYKGIERAEQTGERSVKFHFNGRKTREHALEISAMPILPKHYWEGRDFEDTTLEPPLSSGPYRIRELVAGQSVVYERVEDYWAKDLPMISGLYNFDVIRYDYFRDTTVQREAFKGKVIDRVQEGVSKDWAQSYDFPAVNEGMVIRDVLQTEVPAGGHNFIFNTRRSLFSDARVREAFTHVWNFDWINKLLFHSLYERPSSFWYRSELGHTGLPSEAELALLEPWRDQIPERVFSEPYVPPISNIAGRDRAGQRKAIALLREAGWAMSDGVLTHSETGERFEFEFLLVDPGYERSVLAYSDMLSQIGIIANVRIVESSQFIERVRKFDFDMTALPYGAALSPGAEMINNWGSAAADQIYSGNVGGTKDPAIDALMEDAIAATSRAELVTAVNALDRVLIWNFYIIRGYNQSGSWTAYWNIFGRPDRHARYNDSYPETWWLDPEMEASVEQWRSLGG